MRVGGGYGLILYNTPNEMLNDRKVLYLLLVSQYNFQCENFPSQL